MEGKANAKAQRGKRILTEFEQEVISRLDAIEHKLDHLIGEGADLSELDFPSGPAIRLRPVLTMEEDQVRLVGRKIKAKEGDAEPR